MPRKAHVEWSPLKDATSFIHDLKKHVDKCDAVSMASYSAGAFGNIEAAFYRNEIDKDTMQSMKNEVAQSIHNFGIECKCKHV